MKLVLKGPLVLTVYVGRARIVILLDGLFQVTLMTYLGLVLSFSMDPKKLEIL